VAPSLINETFESVLLHIKDLIIVMIIDVIVIMEPHPFKNVNNCLNTTFTLT